MSDAAGEVEYNCQGKNMIRPYHYTELDRYASPIKLRLLKMTTTLQNGIELLHPTQGTAIDCKKSLENLSESLLALDIKSIYAKSKTYWETRKYAEERIADPQDVDDLFAQSHVQRLVENVGEETMGRNIKEVKHIIDKRAGDIRFAERHIRHERMPSVQLAALSRPERRKCSETSADDSPVERSATNPRRVVFAYKLSEIKPNPYRSAAAGNTIRLLLQKRGAHTAENVLKTPPKPIFPMFLTSISEEKLPPQPRAKFSPLAKAYRALASKLSGSVTTSASPHKTPRDGFSIRKGLVCSLPRISPGDMRRERRNKSCILPYCGKVAEIMNECDKCEDSFSQIKSACQSIKHSVNKSLNDISTRYMEKYQMRLPADMVSDSVKKFHKHKRCFIYGKEGLGAYMEDGKANMIRRSDTYARLNCQLAGRFLEEMEKAPEASYLDVV